MSRLRITCHGEEPAKETSARDALKAIVATADALEVGNERESLGRMIALATAALNPPPSRYPTVNGRVAEWFDVFLEHIDDDGKGTPIHNVTSITWRAAQGNSPTSATIEFFDVEIDAELEVARSFSVDVGGNVRRPLAGEDA